MNLFYNFALVWAFFSTGSIFVAFITSPLTFNFPDMNSLCACVLPPTSLPKSSSDNDRVTVSKKVVSEHVLHHTIVEGLIPLERYRADGSRLTISLLSCWGFSLSHVSLFLQIYVPTRSLPLFVFQSECKHGVTFLDCVLSLTFISLQ